MESQICSGDLIDYHKKTFNGSFIYQFQDEPIHEPSLLNVTCGMFN